MVDFSRETVYQRVDIGCRCYDFIVCFVFDFCYYYGFFTILNVRFPSTLCIALPTIESKDFVTKNRIKYLVLCYHIPNIFYHYSFPLFPLKICIRNMNIFGIFDQHSKFLSILPFVLYSNSSV